MHIVKRKCDYCQRPIYGRSDKRFCDDLCRNTFNNKKRTEVNHSTRVISNQLRKNRKVLERVLDDGVETVKVPKEKLIRLGFHFNYLTHFFISNKGNTFIYCYDYGYLDLGNEWLLIVRDLGEDMPISYRMNTN